MVRSILYVSNIGLPFSDRESGVRDIVGFSRKWNASVGITGALVFTERHFLQLIEGPVEAVGKLLENLLVDPRHSDVNIIEDVAADAPQFQQWSLAYSGPDSFIDDELIPLLQRQPGSSRRVTARHLRSQLSAMVESGHSQR